MAAIDSKVPGNPREGGPLAPSRPVVVARDAGYAHDGYRSFEFTSFEAPAGEVTALLSADAAAGRDLLLAVAGLVRPLQGSLVVDGVELAGGFSAAGDASVLDRLRTRARAARREKLSAGTVGLGVVSGVLDAPASLSVEEAVGRVFSPRRARGAVAGADPAGTDPAGPASDLLSFLGACGLATMSDVSVADLPAPGRARLSAALALAGMPRAACVDLSDPFCAGLSVPAARSLMRDLARLAHALGCAVIVATADRSVAAEAAVFVNLDAEEVEA